MPTGMIAVLAVTSTIRVLDFHFQLPPWSFAVAFACHLSKNCYGVAMAGEK
jgi:hypothetical protein